MKTKYTLPIIVVFILLAFTVAHGPANAGGYKKGGKTYIDNSKTINNKTYSQAHSKAYGGDAKAYGGQGGNANVQVDGDKNTLANRVENAIYGSTYEEAASGVYGHPCVVVNQDKDMGASFTDVVCENVLMSNHYFMVFERGKAALRPNIIDIIEEKQACDALEKEFIVGMYKPKTDRITHDDVKDQAKLVTDKILALGEEMERLNEYKEKAMKYADRAGLATDIQYIPGIIGGVGARLVSPFRLFK